MIIVIYLMRMPVVKGSLVKKEVFKLIKDSELLYVIWNSISIIAATTIGKGRT